MAYSSGNTGPWVRGRGVCCACGAGQLLTAALCFSPSPCSAAPGEVRHMFTREIYWSKNEDGAEAFVYVSPSLTFHLMPLNGQLQSIKTSGCCNRRNKPQKQGLMNKLIGNLFVWSRHCKTNWQRSVKQNQLAGSPVMSCPMGLSCLLGRKRGNLHSEP